MINSWNTEQSTLVRSDIDLFARISTFLDGQEDYWKNPQNDSEELNFLLANRSLGIMRKSLFADERANLIKNAIIQLSKSNPFINITAELDKLFIDLIGDVLENGNAQVELLWPEGLDNIPDQWFQTIANEIIKLDAGDKLLRKYLGKIFNDALFYLDDFNLEVSDLPKLNNLLPLVQSTSPNILTDDYGTFSLAYFANQTISNSAPYVPEIPEFITENSFDAQISNNFDLMKRALEKAIDQELSLQIKERIANEIVPNDPPGSYEQAEGFVNDPTTINYELFLPGIEDLLSEYNLTTAILDTPILTLDSDNYGINGNFSITIDLKLPNYDNTPLVIYERTDFPVELTGAFLDSMFNILSKMNLNLSKTTINEKELVGPGKLFASWDDLAAKIGNTQYWEISLKNNEVETLEFFEALTGLAINWNFIGDLQDTLGVESYPSISFEATINNNHNITYRLKIFSNGSSITVPINNSQHLKTALEDFGLYVESNLTFSTTIDSASFENVNSVGINSRTSDWVIDKYTNWPSVESELQKQLALPNLTDRFNFWFYFSNDGIANSKSINLIIFDKYLKNEYYTFTFKDNIVDYGAITSAFFKLLKENYHILENSPVARAKVGDKVSRLDVMWSIADSGGNLINENLVDPAWTFYIKEDQNKDTYLVLYQDIDVPDFSSSNANMHVEHYEDVLPIKKYLDRTEINDAIKGLQDRVDELISKLPEDSQEALLIAAIMAATSAAIWELFENGKLTRNQLNALIAKALLEIENIFYNEPPINSDVLEAIIKEYDGAVPPELLYWMYENADLIDSWLASGASVEDIVKILKNENALDFIEKHNISWEKILDQFIKLEKNYHYGFFGVGVGLGIVGLGAAGGAITAININQKNKKIQKITPKANLRINFSRKIAWTMTILSLLTVASSVLLLVWFFVSKGGF